uniref:NIF3-like protein 1 n=1 Tax=Oryctolagus cuniculus TaxID=9986 RepID=A0A5F9D465_RABIT
MLSSCARLAPSTVRLVHSLDCSSSRSFMDLKALISSLNDFASLSFAESWDNVGLLVEPSPPHTVNTLFLTNDLTEPVMEEALQKKADLILSYHPPIFLPMKRITWKSWKERLVIRALENRVAIYSPHTAYDAAPQGVNNWLSKGLGACTSRPICPSKAHSYPTEGTHRVEFNVNHTQDLDKVVSAVREIEGVSVTSFSARTDGEEQTRISLNCTEKALMQVVAQLSQNRQLYQRTEILSLEKSHVLKLWPCVLVLGAASCGVSKPTFTSQVRCPIMMSWMLLPEESASSSVNTVTRNEASCLTSVICWVSTWRIGFILSCQRRTGILFVWCKACRDIKMTQSADCISTQVWNVSQWS